MVQQPTGGGDGLLDQRVDAVFAVPCGNGDFCVEFDGWDCGPMHLPLGNVQQHGGLSQHLHALHAGVEQCNVSWRDVQDDEARCRALHCFFRRGRCRQDGRRVQEMPDAGGLSSQDHLDGDAVVHREHDLRHAEL